jgi:hypothetical protein
MLRGISFLLFTVAMIAALAHWQVRLESASASLTPHGARPPGALTGPRPDASPETRRQLIEVLDRLVSYQQYYREVYGHYTRLLGRIGYAIPDPVSRVFEVRVLEASTDRLLITAFSEEDGKTADVLTIDQDFRLQANFELPAPSPEFLRAQAYRLLRAYRDSDRSAPPAENGIYRGYFRFALRSDSQDRRTALATGTRAPVEGVQLELGPGAEIPADAEPESPLLAAEEGTAPRTGEASSRSSMSTLEEAFLAQKIFRGEIGRYARSWAELSRIAHFRFAGKEDYGSDRVPFGDSAEVPEIDAAALEPAGSARQPAAVMKPTVGDLEIEPIGTDN